MEHKHLDAAALERLLAVDRSAEQNDHLFHTLAACPVCREAGGWLLELHQAAALPPVFGLIDAVLARSRAEAPQLFQELAALDPAERLARLHADPRFVSWGLCELLIRESRQAAQANAAEAVHLADLAVHVADLIPEGEPYEEKWLFQLRALAWAALGNAYKVQGDLSVAERSFEMSAVWWEAGTVSIGDVLGYEPVLLDLKASLRMAQRRFPEALKLLDQAVDLFLHGQPEHQDSHLAGKSLIKRAYVLIEMGSPEAAIEVLRKANGLIDPERDPRLVLCIHHNLVDNLSKMGRHAEAADLLPSLRDLAAAHGSTLDHLRLQWVEGRVAAGLGDHAQARHLLAGVRQVFLDNGNPYEAALATLDLVIPHLEEGNTAEVRALADEMVTVFCEHDVSREALAALLLFQEAARRETATADLARRVAASLASAFSLSPGGREGRGSQG
jgi:tetratricopeptide (TPR) repeat protein